MNKLTFITGGARSGKSSFAQKQALEICDNPIYIATARVWDEDFNRRIERHKQDRGTEWQTIEETKRLDKLNINGKTLVLDCLTLWLTNIFHDNEYDFDKSLLEAKKIWNNFIAKDITVFVVSNELGMGVHAEHNTTRKFVDLQGFINQHIAGMADEAYLMVSGIPVKIK
ncbi:MAG: bifunctional adenosylcobinamide kinase/adenosylcobinamide-phosphate guanylyltransferase [Bacteroidales bacterium]|nr:bifunctional adenosylcobinamide kinase/adenosylcobinamide-phosphate guanylyltransferase [Bacteroidales bacterium]